MPILVEEWREVKALPGYFISESGRLFNNRAHREVVGSLNADGYRCFVHNQKTHRFSALVSEAFLGPRPEGKEVDHIDGNRQNDRADNLRYVTHKENCNNPVTVKRYSNCAGAKNSKRWQNPEYRRAFIVKITAINRGSSKWKNADVSRMIALRDEGATWAEIGRVFESTGKAIQSLIRRRLTRGVVR